MRARRGSTSLSSSTHLPARLAWSRNMPVTLPPGLAQLWISLAPIRTAPHPWTGRLDFFQAVSLRAGRAPLIDRQARSGLYCRSRCAVAFSARIVEAHEPMRVQAFHPELAVKRLDEGIVGGFAGAFRGLSRPAASWALPHAPPAPP